eukprot:UN27121
MKYITIKMSFLCFIDLVRATPTKNFFAARLQEDPRFDAIVGIHKTPELFNKLNTIKDMPALKIEKLFEEGWNDIVFIRDPLERWVNAYNDKCNTNWLPTIKEPWCKGKEWDEYINLLWDFHKK